MDNQSYLDQITKDSKKPKKSNFFTSKIFIFIASAVALLLIIVIANATLSSRTNAAKNKTLELSLHVDNLISTISTYQPNLKSSKLRGYSASLSSILSETSSTLSSYIAEKYDIKKTSSYGDSLIKSETALSDETNTELFSAKINGILDRTYAYTMAYEISIITAHESEILSSIKDSNTAAMLESSYSSLTNLYENFNNFSES